MQYNRLFTHIASILLCLSLTGIYKKSNAQTADIANNFIDTMICIEGNFQVPISINGTFADSNVFRIELSDKNGSFSAPVLVGTVPGPNAGTANCKLPASVTAGLGYRIRVRSIYPAYTSSPFFKTIRVSDYPSFSSITSNGPLCEGDNLTLNATSNNFSPTFDWTGPNGFNTTNQANPSKNNVTVADKGTYRVTVTSYKCATEDTIDVLIVPQPVWYGWDVPDTFVCEGQRFKIKPECSICNLSSNLVEYTWSYPPGGSSKQSALQIISSSMANNGTFMVTVQLAGQSSTCSVTDTFTPLIKPLPDTPTVTSNGPLCVGDTLLLDGNSTSPGVSYKWEGAAGFYDSGLSAKSSLPDIQKSGEGEYKLYAYKDGCPSAPGIVDLEIGEPLTKIPVSGDTMLCPGDKIQLSAQTPTTKGIEWRKASADSIIISQNRSYGKSGVSHDDSGLYYVTQELLGCKSPPAYINIIIPDLKKPEPTNNGPLCLGEKLQLSSTSSVNASYEWTGPDGFSSNAQNPTLDNITTSSGGIYTIITTLDYCTEEDTTEVIIKPMPEITDINSNSPVCTYTYLNLEAKSSLDSSSYEWTGPQGFTSNEQNPSIYYQDNTSGTYTVRAILDGCISESRSTEVESREGPGITKASSNGPLTEGETLELYAENNKDSVIYSWVGPNDFISDEKNPIIPVATFRYNGEYELFSIYNTCTTSTKILVAITDILGITLDLYPNPNDGRFTVEGITQTDAPVHLNIFNHLGRVMHREEVIPEKAKFSTKIDLNGAPSGVYILQAIAGNEELSVRFTIVRQ